MPTLDRYDALMSDRKFYGAAREACRCAAEIIRKTNPEADVNKNIWTKLTAGILAETVERYLHAARLAVGAAVLESDQDQLRAIKRDCELIDTLDDERGTLRSKIEDAIQTLPG